MASIEERVKKIVAEQLGIDEVKVVPEASFVDDLGADSLDNVELVMALEEEFNTEISDDEAEKIATVKDAIEFIKKLEEKRLKDEKKLADDHQKQIEKINEDLIEAEIGEWSAAKTEINSPVPITEYLAQAISKHIKEGME